MPASPVSGAAVTVTTQGTIIAPSAPGLGFKVRRERIDALIVGNESFSV